MHLLPLIAQASTNNLTDLFSTIPTWIILFASAVVIFIIGYVLTIRNPGKVESGADLRKLNKNPQLHLGAKTRHIERQTEFLGAQATKVAMVDALENTGIRLKDDEDLRRSTHDVLMAQNEANLYIINQAADSNMSTEAYNDVRVAEETARIEVQKVRELEDNRLNGYEREASIDIRAALGMHLRPIELIDHLGLKIEQLKAQKAEQSRIDYMEKFREQMARRLLEAPDKENLEGADFPT